MREGFTATALRWIVISVVGLSRIHIESCIRDRFITHKLNEIMAVADRCTVLRKGKYMGTVDIKDTTKEEDVYKRQQLYSLPCISSGRPTSTTVSSVRVPSSTVCRASSAPVCSVCCRNRSPQAVSYTHLGVGQLVLAVGAG